MACLPLFPRHYHAGYRGFGQGHLYQRVQGAYWKSMGDSLHLKYMPLNAERGSIYSEDGNMLSTPFLYLISMLILVRKVYVKKKENVLKIILTHSACRLSNLFGDESVKSYKG